MTSDASDLVAAAQGGDRRAMEALLERHYDAIHALCRRITADPSDADDATQEALIAVVRGLAGFDGRSSFSTWVYRVSTNACLDELRRRRRRPIAVEPVEQVDRDDFESAVADRDEVDRWLGSLPVEFRTAVTLRDVCGLDYAEIADVLGVPIGTVRSRIARGRRLLADTFPGNFSANGDVETGDHD